MDPRQFPRTLRLDLISGPRTRRLVATPQDDGWQGTPRQGQGQGHGQGQDLGFKLQRDDPTTLANGDDSTVSPGSPALAVMELRLEVQSLGALVARSYAPALRALGTAFPPGALVACVVSGSPLELQDCSPVNEETVGTAGEAGNAGSQCRGMLEATSRLWGLPPLPEPWEPGRQDFQEHVEAVVEQLSGFSRLCGLVLVILLLPVSKHLQILHIRHPILIVALSLFLFPLTNSLHGGLLSE